MFQSYESTLRMMYWYTSFTDRAVVSLIPAQAFLIFIAAPCGNTLQAALFLSYSLRSQQCVVNRQPIPPELQVWELVHHTCQHVLTHSPKKQSLPHTHFKSLDTDQGVYVEWPVVLKPLYAIQLQQNTRGQSQSLMPTHLFQTLLVMRNM